jgi:hypothetical protein
MSGSLTVDLLQGYREHADSLPEETRDLIALARESYAGTKNKGWRGRLFMALVLDYRAGPRDLWAPVLLDILAPGLLAVVHRLRAEPPVMDEEDIRQELVAEVLCAAAYMPIPKNPTFMRRRLMARANQGVRRRLARERQRQSSQEPVESLDPIRERR